jgi:hypothetical protein
VPAAVLQKHELAWLADHLMQSVISDGLVTQKPFQIVR